MVAAWPRTPFKVASLSKPAAQAPGRGSTGGLPFRERRRPAVQLGDNPLVRHVSRPDPDQLQQWLREGLPAASVGKRLGLSRATGYAWLHRYGLTADTEPLAQKQLLARWQDSSSVEQIAAATGLPAAAVRERLITATVLRPNRSYIMVGSHEDPLPEPRLRQWYLLLGVPVQQIAELAGMSERQVRYRLARYQLSRGRPGPAPRSGRRTRAL